MPAWGNLGNALKHMRHYRQAARALRRAQALAPRSPAVRLDLALVYISARRYRRAIPVLQAALRLSPANARLLQLLGLAQLNAGEYRRAARSLARARRRQPQPGFSLLYSLAAARMMSGETAAGRRTLRQMLLAYRHQPALHLLLGQALLNQGRARAARVEFRRALALAPRLADAQLGLGLVALGRRHYAAAVRRFSAALRLRPRCVTCWYERGATEYLERRYAAAARDLRRAIALGGPALRPGVPHAATVADAWYYLARLALHQPSSGPLRAARLAAARSLRSAIRLDPDAPAPHYLLGRTLAELGNAAAARRQFQLFQHLRRRKTARGNRFFRRAYRRELKSHRP